MIKSSRKLWKSVMGAGVVAAVAGGSWAAFALGYFERPSPLASFKFVPASRSNLLVTIVAPGDVQSSNATTIECELENLRVHSEGGTARASGSSVIIDLVEDGTYVAKDDVLCELDASEYEELKIQQEIKNQAARADYDKAALDLKSAEIAFQEYRDGRLMQLRANFKEQIKLYQSDIERQTERIKWTEEMVRKGYYSDGAILDAKEKLLKSTSGLEGQFRERDVLEEYTAPIALKRLEITLIRAQEDLRYQSLRLEHREEQLQRLVDQIKACTIRAPHEGMVIYEDDNDIPIQLGTEVYEHMDLFRLPDLSNMEVWTPLHESVATRVALGVPAILRVNGLPGQEVEGHVTSIDPLPMPQQSRRESGEVKNFLAKIKVDNIPRGLMPGMTAEVEILAGREPNSLVVPSGAVSVAGGKTFCYVANGETLERHEVRTAPGNLTLVRIEGGLSEGDRVLADPTKLMESDLKIVDIATELPPIPMPSFASELTAEDYRTESKIEDLDDDEAELSAQAETTTAPETASPTR